MSETHDMLLTPAAKGNGTTKIIKNMADEILDSTTERLVKEAEDLQARSNEIVSQLEVEKALLMARIEKINALLTKMRPVPQPQVVKPPSNDRQQPGSVPGTLPFKMRQALEREPRKSYTAKDLAKVIGANSAHVASWLSKWYAERVVGRTFGTEKSYLYFWNYT